MGARIRAHDWTATQLGAPNTWPQPLRAALSICLHSSIPTAIYWGPDLCLLYNDAWSPVPAEKHPWALGRLAHEVWPDIWDVIAPQFRQVFETGEGFSAFDQLLPMQRGGRVEETYWNYSFAPIRADDGTVLGIFNQGHETTAQVVTRRDREDEIARLRDMFVQAPGAVALLRGPTHIFEITNDAHRALIGNRDVIGKSVADALPEMVDQGFIDLLDQVYRSGEPHIGKSVSVVLQHDAGAAPEERLLDFVYQPIKDATGHTTGIFVAATDVTERARAETALRESEAELRRILELNPQLPWTGDAQGRIIDFSDRGLLLTGLTRDQARSGGWAQATHPDDRPDLEKAWAQSIASGEPYDIDHRVRMPDGSYCWVRSRAVPWRDPKTGAVRRWYGTTEDIDERARARTALHKSEERLQLALSASNSIGTWDWDIVNDRVTADARFAHLYGVDARAASAGASISDFFRGIHPDDIQRVQQAIATAMQTGNAFSEEYRLVQSDGTECWVAAQGRCTLAADGTPLRFSGISFDITKRKLAEDALRESEMHKRLALEAARVGVWSYFPPTGELIWDDRCKALFGLGPDATVTYDTFLDGCHPDDRDRLHAAVRGATDPRSSGRIVEEYRTIGLQDGVERWLGTQGQATFDHGVCTRFIGVVVDITQRKKSEEILRESEERFRLVAESAPVMLWMGDRDGKCVYLNRAQRAFWGVSEDAVATFDWSSTLHPDDRLVLLDPFNHSMQTHSGFSIEARSRRADGEWRIMATEAQPRFSPSGEFLGMIGVNVDVTATRKATMALHESEIRFRAITNSIDQLIWSTRPDGFHDYFNDRWYEYTDAPPGSTDSGGLNALLHADDRDRADKLWRQCLATGEPYHIEYRLRHRTGNYRWVLARAQPVRDNAGLIVRWFGTCTDVHELKIADERQAFLLTLNDRLRATSDPATATLVAAGLLGTHIGGARAGYGEIDETGEFVHIERDWTRDDTVASLGGETRSLEGFGPAAIATLRTGRTLVVEDCHTDPRAGAAYAAAWDSIGCRALIVVPLISDGLLRAILYLHEQKPRRWSTADVALVEDVAQRTWDAAERARAQHALRALNASLATQVRERTGELSKAVEALRASATRQRTMFETSFIYQGLLNPDGTILDANASSLAGIESTLEDVIGKPLWEAGWFSGTPGVPEMVRRAVAKVAGGETIQTPLTVDLPTGKRSFDFSLRPVKNQQNVVIAIVPEAVETTSRIKAEEQLRQAQKMEAVGQLTGGIAHDFNNMLAVVIGGLNLLQRRLARGDTNVSRYIDAAMEGATRAAALTQRLLAFSRQQPLAPEPVDANSMVSGMTELLTRTLGEAIRVETVLFPGLWKTHADPIQLESAILNLSVNARDAMPEGGRLTIETANIHLDEYYAREFAVAAGEYVQIAVSDTGVGMKPDVVAKAFDPFFTTKGVGKGTGLGLSQVFGFIRQSGGQVKIYSEIKRGTAVKIYLPRFHGEAEPVAQRRTTTTAPGGNVNEIVLVVEDEDRVRGYSVEALRDLGYTVVHASNGTEALRMIEAGQDVTLLFTDVVMPGMTGRQLADHAINALPTLKVLFTTGYTRNAVVHNGILDPGTNFLPKPFSIEQLAAKVRSALDE